MTNITRKAFVLLSGGLDSTTCLYKAIEDYAPNGETSDTLLLDQIECPWVEAFSVYYGQRHKKEMEYAQKTCSIIGYPGVRHTILDVGDLLRGKHVMLTDDSRDTVEIPDMSYDDIKGVSPTYVPFRNGLLLSAITAQAQKWVNEANKQYDSDIALDLDTEKPQAGVYFGAHAEDAHNWAYPDCTPEFIGAMANAIYIGSYMQIRLHTPLQWLNKAGVVQLGCELGVPFENTWSCYAGDEYHCGICPTCRSRRAAFTEIGVTDPTTYAA